MLNKLNYFQNQIREAIKEHPELKQQILDIHDLYMLYLDKGESNSPFKTKTLDVAIDDLEQLIKDNTEESNYTDWTNEWETQHERDL